MQRDEEAFGGELEQGRYYSLREVAKAVELLERIADLGSLIKSLLVFIATLPLPSTLAAHIFPQI